jgi:hypothetical protein
MRNFAGRRKFCREACFADQLDRTMIFELMMRSLSKTAKIFMIWVFCVLGCGGFAASREFLEKK